MEVRPWGFDLAHTPDLATEQTPLRSADHGRMPSRLFVALWPDESARTALSATVKGLHPAHPEVRWQPPERWHLTLAFLGQAQAATAIRRITRALPQPAPDSARPTQPAEPDSATAGPIRLTGAGTFGPVLWVGVEHGPWLTRLARDLQNALHVSDRRFRAHVTVGRVRGADAPARARSVLADFPDHEGPWWTPQEVTLVESMTGPTPAYRVLERWPLTPAIGPGPAPAPSATT